MGHGGHILTGLSDRGSAVGNAKKRLEERVGGLRSIFARTSLDSSTELCVRTKQARWISVVAIESQTASYPMKRFAEMLTELVHKWCADGVVIGEGASDADIRTLEERFNVELPGDVVAYLKRVDGMASRDYPEDSIRFWQLNEFESARPAHGDGEVFEGWIVFADFLIHSHFYVFRAGRSSLGEVAISGGDGLLPVASSFAEFIHRYLHDRTKLFQPSGPAR